MSTDVPYNTSQASTNQNTTTNVVEYFDYISFMYAYIAVCVVLSVAGTVVNVWFLVAVLRSVDLRSRLRNKLICNVFVLHLVNSVVLLPLFIVQVLFFIKREYSCHLISFTSIIVVIQDTMSNWLLVLQIIVFIAQIVDFNPEMKLTPWVLKFGTWALLIVPWILTVIIVPIALYVYHMDILQYTNGCVYLTVEMQTIFRSFDMVAPMCIMVILLVIAAFLKYKGIRCGQSNGSMLTVLVGQASVTDSIFVYVAAVAVALVSDLITLVITLGEKNFESLHLFTMYIVWVVTFALAQGRVVLMVLPWLLLPDIRDRIKTWRPWYRPIPGIDLTMTNKKEGGD